MASALFEKTSLSKLRFSNSNKPRPIRIMVVGQRGVGKTAMVVRFITRRFIGDYDSTTDKVYNYSTFIDNEMMTFEIIDTPGVRNVRYMRVCPSAPGAEDVDSPANTDALTEQPAGLGTANTIGSTSSTDLSAAPDADLSALEKHIQHADAFIIMYSVTDKCSFDDCNRLRFLINYNSKQRRRSITKDSALDIPVMLVGNKKDQKDDRMVDVGQGRKMYQQMSCAGFHEISVRESADEVWNVFRDLCRCWRIFQHYPKLKRSTSDAQTISYMLLSPEIGMGSGTGSAGGGAGASGSSGGYFDGWWSRSTEKRQSFFAFRSNGSNTAIAAASATADGSSDGSSTQQSPSAEDVTDVGDAASCAPAKATGTTKKLSIRIPTQQQLLLQQQQQQQLQLQQLQPFRERASTDGKILSRPRRWQYMTAGSPTSAVSPSTAQPTVRLERRMSISQRGSNGN